MGPLFKSLKLKILSGFIAVVFLTTSSILVLSTIATEKVVSDTQNENARNLVNTVILDIENQYKSILFLKEASLERRKAELRNITDIVSRVIGKYITAQKSGILSATEAKKQAAAEIETFRYDNGVGYIWINNTDRPFPKMIMHPTIPDLNGTVLDNPEFNCALGRNENLFTASVDICLESGEGYIDYLWPKPLKSGLTEKQPKISLVSLIMDWNWVIGTGLYIDDIEEDVQKRLNAVLTELKETFAKIRFAESGYMYIFNSDKTILVHPSLEGLDGSLIKNQETGNFLFDELIQASKTPEIPFKYIWDKPQSPGDFRFYKQAYISYFEPLDWYIVSSIYIDEIKKPSRELGQQILLFSIILLLIAVILSLLLSRNLAVPLGKLMVAAREIELKGTLDTEIPVTGTQETRELGLILQNMIKSIRKTGDQLRQAQKMETVGTLAGGLAHDFNNMLGGIVGTLSLMQNRLDTDGFLENKKLEEYMSTMNECSLRAASMVQQLLALSRKQEMSFTSVDLNTTVSHVMKICENSFDKSVQLTRTTPDYPVIVKADPTQIEQVLLNLCVNAEHSMTIMRNSSEKWGGELSISISEITADSFFIKTHPELREGDYYLLSVRDTGTGMDVSTVAKIFNPFFTTKKNGVGSGLGLSMVYNIVKQHEGMIDVYSEPGLGSSFHIYLPVLREDKTGKKEESSVKKLPAGNGLVLIIDDEKTMRNIAAEILKTCGYDVLLAENGLEGVRLFKKYHESIKAVLLDMVMPKISGKEAFIKMKAIDPDVKVILTSGFRQDDRVQKVLELGVEMFVQKPYTLEKLANAIDDVLKKI